MNGKNHRDENDGSALIFNTGSGGVKESWYQYGRGLHRLGGAAVIFDNGQPPEWYINNKLVPCHSQEEFERYLKLIHFQ